MGHIFVCVIISLHLMQETQLPPHRRNAQDPLCDSSMFMAPICAFCFNIIFLKSMSSHFID